MPPVLVTPLPAALVLEKGNVRALIVSCLVSIAGFATAPVTAHAQSPLTGEWQWSCCGGGIGGKFRIDSVGANGSFTGQFLATNASDRGQISGRITGTDVVFTRSGATTP